MTNKPHEDELQAYVDGQLNAEDEARIEDYLATHPDERHRIESYRRQKALLRLALVDAAGQSGLDRLSLDRAPAGNRSRPGLTVSPASIAAGLAIFFLGAASHIGLQAYSEWRLPAGLEVATEAHRVFAEDGLRPVEIPASHRAEMEQSFERHLGTQVEIPDLGSLGLRLVGGRLLASAEGPMAQLLYEDRRRNRLTVYLTADETDIGSQVEVVNVAGFSAGFWQDGELTYTIVAEMEADALMALAAEMSGTADFPQL